jgi:hypothetical protein
MQRQTFFLFSLGVCLLLSLEPSWAARLYIKAEPVEANITIWNIKPKFHQGIKLKAGRYDVQITSKGYKTWRKWIRVGRKNRRVKINLIPKKQTLTIKISPAHARIRILNIKPTFKQGMSLPAGEYLVDIQAKNYQPLQEIIEIAHEGVHLRRTLSKIGDVEQLLRKSMQSLDAEKVIALGGEILKQHALYIQTSPPNSQIIIHNIKPQFRQGMRLDAGRYDIEITHLGYQSHRRWIVLDRADVNLDVNLVTLDRTTSLSILQKDHIPPEGKYALFINAQPKGASIHFLNTNFSFKQGMRLPKGRYQLKISKPHYPARVEWIGIIDQDVYSKVVLSEATQCFESNKNSQRLGNSSQLKQYVTLRHYGRYVEAIYTVNAESDGHVNRFRLIGEQKKSGELDLIGTIYYGNTPAELHSQMHIVNRQLMMDFDGQKLVLQKIACQASF